MNKQLFIRGLCVLIAVQLFAAPFTTAYADAAHPPVDAVQTAAPDGGDLLDENEPGGGTLQAHGPAYAALVGYGVPVYDTNYDQLGIRAYKGYFRVETESQARYVGTERTLFDSEAGNNYMYHIFPSRAVLGRVPDMDFAGWYLYDATADKGQSGNWLYYRQGYAGSDGTLWEETAPDLREYKAGDPGFEQYGETHDSWTGLLRTEYNGYPGGSVLSCVYYIGKWVPSSFARAKGDGADGIVVTPKRSGVAGVEISDFYHDEITGVPTTSLTAQPFEATRGGPYYLRLEEAVDTIDITFRAWEPYYDYHMQQSGDTAPVTVTVKTQDGETTYAWDAHRMAPQATYVSAIDVYIQANTVADPAHSVWTVRDIPLAKSTAGSIYNEITIAVTAPDGVTTKEYTFLLQRVTTPTLTQNPGNTPVGMILRDTSAVWGSGDAAIAAAKQAAITRFSEQFQFNFNGTYPRGAENRYGSIYQGMYGGAAWVGPVNYDLHETAIVVYQDTAFQDPGIAVTDTTGAAAHIGTGETHAGSISRSIRLRAADHLKTSDIKDGSGNLYYYQNGALVAEMNPENNDIARDGQGMDQIDLRGLNVLPGVYEINYHYKDPMTGETYFLGSRPLIVLPIPGDADMDGAVTLADAAALRKAVDNPDGASRFNNVTLGTDRTATLFAYRVADVTGNAVLSTDDWNKISAGFAPALQKTSGSDYFYLPLPTGDDAGEGYRSRVAVESVIGTADKARLSLRFMGLETGTYHPDGENKYLTTDAVGPNWTGTGMTDSVVLGDTFWVGIRLDDAALFNVTNAAGITLTLTYDSRYVKPAVVFDVEDKGAGMQLGSEAEAWLYSMRAYNVSAHSQTIWGHQSTYSTTAATTAAREFTPHYSRPITALERGADKQSSLKELVFSIQHTGAGVQVQDGWLLAAPFTLIRHPYGTPTPTLIELGVGMRELLVLEPNAVTQMRAPAQAGGTLQADTGSGVSAYSAQTGIFGDYTNNLSGRVGFTVDGIAAPIPLGEDETPAIVLVNGLVGSEGRTAVYGDPFSCYIGGLNLTLDEGAYPPGLTYNEGTGYILGTPTRAGDYRFILGEQAYFLKVDKTPLRIYADDRASYYGTAYCRGDKSGDITFGFYEDDLKALDREGPINGADGATLVTLLAGMDYVAPTFTARTEGGTPVGLQTPVGTYLIDCVDLPTCADYRFEYVRAKPGQGGNTGRLTIVRRPIVVDHLAMGTDMGAIYSDDSAMLSGRTATLSSAAGAERSEFAVRLPSEDANPGYYNGSSGPLSESDGGLVPGDTLRITFTAEYIRTATDLGGTNETFVLNASNMSEPRNVKISDIRLSGQAGGSESNYTLISAHPLAQHDAAEVYYATGTVRRREITALRIVEDPIMNYRYGERMLDLSALLIFMEKGESSSQFPFSVDIDGTPTDTSAELMLSWATEAEMLAGEVGSLPFVWREILTCDTHSGRYLCVARATGTGDETTYMTAYTKNPLVVQPRTVVLTAVPIERYYGSENGTLAFTYNPNQLADHHRLAAQADGATGKGEELLWVLAGAAQAYSPPELRAQLSMTNETAVTAATPVTGAENAVVKIFGASAANYQFSYANPNADGSAGSAALRIRRRPIVVDEILKQTDLSFVYADTKRLSTAGLTLPFDQFTLKLPAHSTTQTSYFTAKNADNPSGNALVVQVGFAEGEAPVLGGDESRLGLSYTAVMVPERNTWQSYSTCFFTLDGYGADGKKTGMVEVNDLALTGTAASNYLLVYTDSARAGKCLPDKVTSVTGPAIPAQSLNGFYHVVSGTGTIKLRAIRGIEVVSMPNLAFTYGSPFYPLNEHPTAHTRLVANLVYETEGDNYPAGNETTMPITLARTQTVDGKVETTFSDLGLYLCYQPDGVTLTAENYAQYILEVGDDLNVATHNGSRLVVVGRRSDHDAIILSALKENPGYDDTLRVERRALTLQVQDQWRYYGEANAPGQFTFDMAGLAQKDKDALAALSLDGSAAKAVAALAAIGGDTYQAPQFQTAATAGSDVVDAGLGGYPLTLTGGVMDNYTLSYNPGKIYVLRRPIAVDNVISSAQHPVYTIFQNTATRYFYNTLSTNHPGGGKRFDISWAMRDPNDPAYTAAVVKPTAPTGNGLFGSDELWINVTVHFLNLAPGEINLAQGTSLETAVEISGVSINTDRDDSPYRNYVLTTPALAVPGAVGLVQLRKILSIQMITPPGTQRYLYGRTLNLSGMEVEIDYEQIAGVEAILPLVVKYQTREQFAQYGLYVRYGDIAAQLPIGAAERNSMVTNPPYAFRPAASGDHVTIAPTHQSQAQGAPFAANGKGLVVCGKLEGYDAVEPIWVTKSELDAEKVTIAVDPLPLTYTFTAQDKIYDGTTEADGSVSLTNVIHRTDKVDELHTDGITDVVYLVTGAAYEREGGTYLDFPNFVQDYADRGYTFTKGTQGLRFDFLYANVRYADGGHSDASPALPGSPYWGSEQAANTRDGVWDAFGTVAAMPVEVRGMTLAGPDAANYCWSAADPDVRTHEVLRTTRDAAQNGAAAVPYATIAKAARAALADARRPAVQVDVHTNAIRLDYDASVLATSGDPGDDYDSEGHLEYALLYEKIIYLDADGFEVDEAYIYWPDKGETETEHKTVDGGTLTALTTVGYWAGQNGTQPYQDTVFFGGEAVAPALPAGYTADEKDIPTEFKEGDIRKGQLYGWADEDDGFRLYPEGYPGGAVYPGYFLYRTDRAPLPRDTVFWPVVRLAETHNYHASVPLGSDAAVTYALLEAYEQAAAAALTAYEHYLSESTAAARAQLDAARDAQQQAAQALLAGASAIAQAAQDAAAAVVADELAMAENSGKVPEPDEWPVAPPTAAVKTFAQRLDIISAEERRGTDGANASYLVPILQAVWFTDHLDYANKTVLDVAVRNLKPVQYYGYFWDDVYSAALSFDDRGNPFSLRGPLEVEISKKDDLTGQLVKVMTTVNIGHTALIYADLNPPGGDELRGITVTPREVTAQLGDAPIQLVVEFRPADVQRKSVTWTTSDPAVATVSAQGVLTFVGVGTAVITATTYNGKTDSIPVTVTARHAGLYPDSVFDDGYDAPFFFVDESYSFFPEAGMTRGELAAVLYRFYRENSTRPMDRDIAFSDMTGEEPYAEAVQVLSALGIITGVEGGTFEGERPVTRAEMVTMLARMLGVAPDEIPAANPAFVDIAPADTWAWGYISAMCRTGLLNGTGDGYFRPGRELTRAEAAAFLSRILRNRTQSDDGAQIVPIDVPITHWGYEEILRAVNGGAMDVQPNR